LGREPNNVSLNSFWLCMSGDAGISACEYEGTDREEDRTIGEKRYEAEKLEQSPEGSQHAPLIRNLRV
jgi:hypothetical protein